MSVGRKLKREDSKWSKTGWYGKQKEQPFVVLLIVYVLCILMQRAHCKDYVLCYVNYVCVYVFVCVKDWDDETVDGGRIKKNNRWGHKINGREG